MIEVTADTPVRIVRGGPDDDTYSVTVDDVELDITYGACGRGIIDWIREQPVNMDGSVRFGDVWEQCPDANWLVALRNAIGQPVGTGLTVGDVPEQRRRLALAEAEEVFMAERAAMDKKMYDAALAANRTYLRPYATKETT